MRVHYFRFVNSHVFRLPKKLRPVVSEAATTESNDYPSSDKIWYDGQDWVKAAELNDIKTR